MRIAEEGQYINSFLNYRFRKNKNALICICGPTGSGKSYASLSIAQHWYNFYWGKDFPERNICFSIQEVVKRLKDPDIRRKELIILEEAGTNLGSLDFQTKIAKLFTYILQSFRSMNIGLIFNLPTLSMLNKQTRQLIHLHLITKGIDYDEKKCVLDCKVHQLNIFSGKSYWKKPQVVYNHRKVKLKEISYSLPPINLRKVYEDKKKKFVDSLVDNFQEKTELNKNSKEKNKLEKEKERYEKRNKILEKLRDEKGKVRCPNCKRVLLNGILNDKIKCSLCGYVEYYEF